MSLLVFAALCVTLSAFSVQDPCAHSPRSDYECRHTIVEDDMALFYTVSHDGVHFGLQVPSDAGTVALGFTLGSNKRESEAVIGDSSGNVGTYRLALGEMVGVYTDESFHVEEATVSVDSGHTLLEFFRTWNNEGDYVLKQGQNMMVASHDSKSSRYSNTWVTFTLSVESIPPGPPSKEVGPIVQIVPRRPVYSSNGSDSTPTCRMCTTADEVVTGPVPVRGARGMMQRSSGGRKLMFRQPQVPCC